MVHLSFGSGTLASKIYVTPKGVYLRSILAVANSLAHNNISQICYWGQISLKSAAINCSFSDYLTPLGDNIYFAGDDTNNMNIWNNFDIK